MPPLYTLFKTLERRSVSPSNSQSGAALMISLIFLVLLMMLALTAMQSTILQEHMAGNLRDHEMAFQAAEAALRKGERDITASTAISDSQRLVEKINKPLDQWTGNEDAGSSYAISSAAGVAADPLYHVGPPIQVRIGIELNTLIYQPVYTVTARGVGGRPSSVVILQSLIKPVQ